MSLFLVILLALASTSPAFLVALMFEAWLERR